MTLSTACSRTRYTRLVCSHTLSFVPKFTRTIRAGHCLRFNWLDINESSERETELANEIVATRIDHRPTRAFVVVSELHLCCKWTLTALYTSAAYETMAASIKCDKFPWEAPRSCSPIRRLKTLRDSDKIPKVRINYWRSFSSSVFWYRTFHKYKKHHFIG